MRKKMYKKGQLGWQQIVAGTLAVVLVVILIVIATQQLGSSAEKIRACAGPNLCVPNDDCSLPVGGYECKKEGEVCCYAVA